MLLYISCIGIDYSYKIKRSADLDHLRAQGLDDRAIHDAVQVIGFFNYATRVADALGVEEESFTQLWAKA